MRITALGRIAAEAFTWQGPDPKLSLVVKASFRIEPSGLVPSDEVIAVQDEVPARRDRELRYGSDYVPWKGRPEILLVGQARAMVATRCIPVRVALGEVDKRCFALTGAEATSVPLSSTYLRTARDGGARVRVGPMPAAAPGWPDALEPDVDYALFNAAPHDQRLATIAPGAELVLEGVLAGAPTYRTRIPLWRPSALFVAAREQPAGWQPVPLVCDTLWIDADAAIAVLVWRGVLTPAPSDGEIVVAGADRELRIDELAKHLEPSAGRRDHGAGTADLDWGEVAMKGFALPYAPSPPPPPSRPHARSAAVTGEETTSVFDLDPRTADRASQPRFSSTRTVEEDTSVFDFELPSPALPFAPAHEAAPLSSDPTVVEHTFAEPTLDRATEDADRTPPTPRRSLAMAEEATGLLDLEAHAPALPFAEHDDEADTRPPPDTSPPPRFERPITTEATGVFDFTAQGPALPFAGAPDAQGWKRASTLVAPNAPPTRGTLPFVRGELPPHVAAALATLDAMGADVARGGTMEVDIPRNAELPFAPPNRPRAPVPQPPVPKLPVPQPPVPQPPIPQPPPSRPHPSTAGPAAPVVPALPTLPIDVHGAIKAALLDGRRLEEALAEHHLAERVWRLAERRLAIDLARDTPATRDLARSLERAIEAARRARVEAEPSKEDDDALELYATARAELEEADDPRAALAELGIDLDAWETMRRRWTRRALADPAVAQTIRERLTAARQSLRRLRPVE